MADQAINALPTKTAPTTGDKMLMIGAAEEYQIDYDQLATAILNKLTSKTFALDQGTKSLVAALNELNSKTLMSGQISSGNEKKFTLKQRHSYLLTFAVIGSGNAYSDTVSVVIIITGASSAHATAIKWITPEPEIKKANISFTENDQLELVVTTPEGSWIVLGLSEL